MRRKGGDVIGREPMRAQETGEQRKERQAADAYRLSEMRRRKRQSEAGLHATEVVAKRAWRARFVKKLKKDPLMNP